MQTTPTAKQQAATLQMHGQDWDGQDLTGWVITEKLDGCRAYWNGVTLYTKSGNVINAPAITSTLPRHMHLDGEIWAGRGQYETARRFVQYGQASDKVVFVAFDAPGQPGGKATRLEAAWPTGVRWANYRIAKDAKDLHERLKKVLDGGGEGLMASHPDAPYSPGRCDLLLKLKFDSLAQLEFACHSQTSQPALCGLFYGASHVTNRLSVLLRRRVCGGDEINTGSAPTRYHRERLH